MKLPCPNFWTWHTEAVIGCSHSVPLYLPLTSSALHRRLMGAFDCSVPRAFTCLPAATVHSLCPCMDVAAATTKPDRPSGSGAGWTDFLMISIRPLFLSRLSDLSSQQMTHRAADKLLQNPPWYDLFCRDTPPRLMASADSHFCCNIYLAGAYFPFVLILKDTVINKYM